MWVSANSTWVCWLCWLCWCSGKQASFYIIWMNCTVNELVFAFSFVSSNNTDVETTEQFILLHTRYVCDFSGLTNFSQQENIYIVLCLLLRFSFPRWILWCLPRKNSFALIWDCLLISKASYRIVYPEKLFPWPPVCLLASEKVVSFFICEER